MPGLPLFHSRAPSSPAVSLHHLHIEIQPEDDPPLLPSTSGSGVSEAHDAAAAHWRPTPPSLSSHHSFELHDASSNSALPLHSQLQPVSVPSPLPSSPPSPSGTGSSTPTFFASLELQKQEIAREQAGRPQRHRHSVLASLPPPPPPSLPPADQTTDNHISAGPLAQPGLPFLPLRRSLCHHQTVLSSHYCSSLLSLRAADARYPLLFCILSRHIAHEGDNFLLYSYPSSSSRPLHLLALIHTFAILNDATDAITAQSVRRAVLSGDASRQSRDVVASVQEEDGRLYVLAMTGVGNSERRQWEVRVESLLSTLRQVMCTLYGQPSSDWFDPLLSSRQTYDRGAIDPNGPVTVPSVPASGGSFISSLLILASSYYSLALLDPLLRLFCHRMYSYPSPGLSFTPLCGLLAARTMRQEEESVWHATLTLLRTDDSGIDSHSSQSMSAAFAVDSIVLYHHGALVTPDIHSLYFSHSLSPPVLAVVTALLTLNGLLDSRTVSAPASSLPPSPSSPFSPSAAFRHRVFRVQLPRSLEQMEQSDGGTGQAVLSVVAQCEWVAAALLLSAPSRISPSVAPQSDDPYYVEPLRSLVATLLSYSSRAPSQFVDRSPALCYSFSVSPTPFLVVHPDRRSLCPELHSACCRAHSSLLASTRRFSVDASSAPDRPVNNGDAKDIGHRALSSSLTQSWLGELAISAHDHAGHRYWVRARWTSGAGAVLLCERAEADEHDDEVEDKESPYGDTTAHAAQSKPNGVVESSSQAGWLFARGWELLSALCLMETNR